MTKGEYGKGYYGNSLKKIIPLKPYSVFIYFVLFLWIKKIIAIKYFKTFNWSSIIKILF